MEFINTKKFPKATPEIEELLNYAGKAAHGHGDAHGASANDAHAQSESAGHDASFAVAHKQVPLPGNLPVVEAEAVHIENAHSNTDAHTAPHSNTPSLLDEHIPFGDEPPVTKPGSAALKVIRTALPYMGIFLVGIFLYYFYFSTFSFTSITNLFTAKQSATVASQKESALASLEKSQSKNYYAWIEQFYADVSDASVLDPEADNSHNGLTNFQKYLLNLNPKMYDTLNLGMADSQTLSAGLDPSTGAPLTDAQKKIVDTYFDLEVANNRLTLEKLADSQQLAGGIPVQSSFAQASTAQATSGRVAGASIGARNGGATSAGYATPVAPQNTTPSANATDLPGAVNVDSQYTGSLEIPSMKITVPIIWTGDPKNFDQDLKSGLVHYPGTAMPGQIGTSYISGHSSNYAWVKGNYNRVFAHLDELKKDQSFIITVTQTNGQKAKLHYIVTSQQQFKPDDQAQFANTSSSVVALSTCWPVGTTARRLVVFGQLTQVER